jgi:hypothetical protein
MVKLTISWMIISEGSGRRHGGDEARRLCIFKCSTCLTSSP